MNNLEISENSKIYVACPANVATGGPELLHQLVYELTNLGREAYMIYYDSTSKNPVHEAYEKYNNNYVNKLIDSHENVLIVPEVKTGFIKSYKNIRKVIWWLSIDNYYKKFSSTNLAKIIAKRILYAREYHSKRIKQYNKIDHFVQSEYAKQFLLKKGLQRILFLSDYLNDYFVVEQSKNLKKEKNDIVVYNPKKGIKYTEKIISAAKNIDFIPIQNMTKEEVADVLSSAKVYIDFGNHPGKDRIPREASISGCCIITNKRGSAKYDEDVPILDEFKFIDINKNIPKIINKIEDIFENYEMNLKKFDNHRNMIKNEHTKFIADIKDIFL